MSIKCFFGIHKKTNGSCERCGVSLSVPKMKDPPPPPAKIKPFPNLTEEEQYRLVEWGEELRKNERQKNVY